MRINFVGNVGVGYAGEASDEAHIVRELSRMGHAVNFVDRGIWKVAVDENNLASEFEADINIICKWPHFDNRKYVDRLREVSGAPVFYWVWDWLYDPTEETNFNIEMAKAADLYLSGEAGVFCEYEKHVIRPYYFQMDICDENIPTSPLAKEFKYDAIFTGSAAQTGHRLEWLKKINAVVPVQIFSPYPEQWKNHGFEANPAVFGEDFNQLVVDAKINLHFSVAPVNAYGYWSNRIGKVLHAGGFLLAEFAPGMEKFTGAMDFFSSPEEAIEKIEYYLYQDVERVSHQIHAKLLGQRMTSRTKVRELTTLMERYLKGGKEWYL